MTAGFPNLFMITGPGSPSVKTQHDRVDRAARRLDRRLPAASAGTGTIRHRSRSKVPRTAGSLTSTRLPTRRSIRRPTPGMSARTSRAKPRVFMPYVAGLDKYRKICDEVAANDYRASRCNELARIIGRKAVEMDFTGKVALVTGGGNGIGRATSAAFAATVRRWWWWTATTRGRSDRRHHPPERRGGHCGDGRRHQVGGREGLRDGGDRDIRPDRLLLQQCRHRRQGLPQPRSTTRRCSTR